MEHRTLGRRVICPSEPAYYIVDCRISNCYCKKTFTQMWLLLCCLALSLAGWLAKFVFCRENAQTFFRQKVINGNIGVFSSRLLHTGRFDTIFPTFSNQTSIWPKVNMHVKYLFSKKCRIMYQSQILPLGSWIWENLKNFKNFKNFFFFEKCKL